MGPFTKQYTETYNSIAGAEVKLVKLSAGNINMVITNNFQNSISAIIRFPSIRDQLGNPLVL